LKIKIFFLFLFLSSCSAIDKNLVLKSTTSDGWKKQKYKKFAKKGFWQDEDSHWSRYLFYSCDSTSSITLYSHSVERRLFIGPPIVPIFPVFFLGFGDFVGSSTQSFDLRIVIKSSALSKANDLPNQIRFYFNDSTNFTIPSSIRTNAKSSTINKYCDEPANGEYLTIVFHFILEPYKLKKLSIKFSDELNKSLNANFKTLNLIKKTKLHYWTLILNPGYY